MTWQYTIHGEQQIVRAAVIKELIHKGFVKRAFRYACCGLADRLQDDGTRVTLSPRGCGHKLCPRCGRKSGQRIVSRALKHLAIAPHGDLIAMCLTQPQIDREPIRETRARMEKKAKRYMLRMREAGMTAALVATHIIRSKQVDGWHYHIHLLMEFPAGRMTAESVRVEWPKCFQGDEEPFITEKASSLVAPAGPAIPSLLEDTGQLDFWDESKDATARALQYPFRDMAQGCSANRLGGDPVAVHEAVSELMAKSSNWKLRRTIGRWRTRPDKELLEAALEAAKKKGTAKPALAPKASLVDLGNITACWRKAIKGDRFYQNVFTRFETSAKNKSDFARRLLKFCRKCQPGGP